MTLVESVTLDRVQGYDARSSDRRRVDRLRQGRQEKLLVQIYKEQRVDKQQLAQAEKEVYLEQQQVFEKVFALARQWQRM